MKRLNAIGVCSLILVLSAFRSTNGTYTAVNETNPVDLCTAGNAEPIIDFGEIKIDSQIWADKNLDAVAFSNGDPISEAQTSAEWRDALNQGKPAWCYYEENAENGKIYGKLYNWYAVTDPRGLAPKGWHIPSYEEWQKLTGYLGSKAAKKMKTANGWEMNGNGNNKSGFSALPGGFIYKSTKTYYRSGNMGKIGYWWSTHTSGMGVKIDNTDHVSGDFYSKDHGLSVRCLKD
ncbi:MAG: hypothetical protein FD123_701 [Bacteroidetes bacterium]|nr:MAG: hypothetical protein FD123_701 [Bacteroidota bacterium]